MDKETAAHLAKALALSCVRNTFLEELHAGKPPTKLGDYSDVKVIAPDGETPWQDISRFNDDEMKRLMQEVVNKLYTVLVNLNDSEFMTALLQWGGLSTAQWDKPELVKDFVVKGFPKA